MQARHHDQQAGPRLPGAAAAVGRHVHRLRQARRERQRARLDLPRRGPRRRAGGPHQGHRRLLGRPARLGLHPDQVRAHVRQEVRRRHREDDAAPLGRQLLQPQGEEVDQDHRRHQARRSRARLLHVLPHAHRQGLHQLHGREVRRRHQDARRRGRHAHQGRPRAPPEAAPQALHAEVAAGARRPARDACAAPALAGGGAEVPCRLALHRSPRRPVGQQHPHVRSQRPAYDVHFQDDPHPRQGPLLRLRPRLRGHRQDGPEGQDHGPQLRQRQEGGPLRQERPAHHPYDGAQDGGGRLVLRRQHVRRGRHRPVHRQVGHPGRRRRHGRAPDHHHEVLGLARRARRRRRQAPQRPAQAGRGPEAPVQVGPARAGP